MHQSYLFYQLWHCYLLMLLSCLPFYFSLSKKKQKRVIMTPWIFFTIRFSTPPPPPTSGNQKDPAGNKSHKVWAYILAKLQQHFLEEILTIKVIKKVPSQATPLHWEQKQSPNPSLKNTPNTNGNSTVTNWLTFRLNRTFNKIEFASTYSTAQR